VSFNTYVVFFEAAAASEDMADHVLPESVCEAKGRIRGGFDGEPESGVALGEPFMALNIIGVGHSVDNPRGYSFRWLIL
jgi:hypothetical protein